MWLALLALCRLSIENSTIFRSRGRKKTLFEVFSFALPFISSVYRAPVLKSLLIHPVLVKINCFEEMICKLTGVIHLPLKRPLAAIHL